MANTVKLRFTKAEINELAGPPTGKKQIRYRDEIVQGLYLRVSRGGTKTFVFYRKAPGDTKPTEITIGKYPETTIDQARNSATKYNAILAQGKCIQEERRLEESGQMSYQSLHEQWVRKNSLPAITRKMLGQD